MIAHPGKFDVWREREHVKAMVMAAHGRMHIDTGFIFLLLVSVYKVPCLTLVSANIWCPSGGTRNIYPSTNLSCLTFI